MRTAPGLDGDKSIALQAAQSFAHRRFADAELRSESFLGQPGAFFEGTVENVLLDVKVRQLREVGILGDFQHGSATSDSTRIPL
jgi:hypothetical protein